MFYKVKIIWQKKSSEVFSDKKYSREHKWFFDGGIELKASSSPQVVPVPMSNESAVDPEEAFIASISSCHMLWFLSIAADKKFIVETYEDNSEGILEKNSEGKLAVTKINLLPKIIFSGENIPTKKQIEEIHEKAHEKCFIANSVKTEINVKILDYEKKNPT
ncbi:MAG TPA: OsmC family protein [Ignavibacteriaceae bacterium]|nr:OsmC family protein [Ignavibacteriaceae bacterium]